MRDEIRVMYKVIRHLSARSPNFITRRVVFAESLCKLS